MSFLNRVIHRAGQSIILGLFAATLGLAPAAHAVLVNDSTTDPNRLVTFQGASAMTFAGLGFSIGTSASDLKVYTNTFVDPSGLTFGQIVAGLDHAAGSGITSNPLNAPGYTSDGSTVVSRGNARDYGWIQNAGTNPGFLAANDEPWLGTIWDLGGQANQAVVFPIIDHDPLPQEAIEYTVYLTNNPTSNALSDWTKAVLDSVYLEGWQADSIGTADGFTTVWKLPGNATFRYVSVQGVGSGALQPTTGNEDEIDAVAGLTVQGESLSVPTPAASLLGLAGFGLLALRRNRRA
jgi:hypothetical protein